MPIKRNNLSLRKKYLFMASLILFYSCMDKVDKMENANKISGTKTTTKCPVGLMTFINNSKIKHAVILAACDTCAPIHTIGYRVTVDLPELQLKIVKTLKRDCWLELLKNEKTDWAANLILYDLHNKSAVLLSSESCSNWKKYSKEEEIIYWERELK